MKKMMQGRCAMLAITVLLSTVPPAFQGLQAQKLTVYPSVVDVQGLSLVMKDPGASKALKNFHRSYRKAVNPDWSMTRNGWFVCRFSQKEFTRRAFYDARGDWKYSIASYGEDHLPFSVKYQVKLAYPKYQILVVHEIDARELDHPVYLVQAENDHQYLFLKVYEESVELDRTVEKLILGD